MNSAPGAGSTFRVLFPIAQIQDAEQLESPPRSDLQGAGVVLVVDDEAVVRRTARSALERYGYGVKLADDGKRAVEALRENPGEVVAVLLDMAMPVISGEDALAEIKRIRPDVPLIVSSGYSEQVASQRFGGSVEIAGFL